MMEHFFPLLVSLKMIWKKFPVKMTEANPERFHRTMLERDKMSTCIRGYVFRRWLVTTETVQQVPSLPSGPWSSPPPDDCSSFDNLISQVSSLNGQKMVQFFFCLIFCSLRSESAHAGVTALSQHAVMKQDNAWVGVLPDRKAGEEVLREQKHLNMGQLQPQCNNSCYCWFLAEPEICPCTYFTSHGEYRRMVCTMLETFHLLSKKSSSLTQTGTTAVKVLICLKLLCSSFALQGPESFKPPKSPFRWCNIYTRTVTGEKLGKNNGRWKFLFPSELCTFLWIPTFWFTKPPCDSWLLCLQACTSSHPSPGTLTSSSPSPVPLTRWCNTPAQRRKETQGVSSISCQCQHTIAGWCSHPWLFFRKIWGM